MKSRRMPIRRLLLEELEGRLAPSATPVLGYSTNWSGYAVQAPQNSVSLVSGTWTVPTVTGSTGYSVSWVGIDGWSSSTVEQIGTESDMINGHAVYSAWYEMYPSNSVSITKMTIQPGDTITGQVSWAAGSTKGGTYTLTLTDTSRANDTFSIAVKSNSAFARSSAEWVVEAPSSGGILPLANFSKETFTAAKATINGVSGPLDSSWANTQLEQINMLNQRGATLDTTGSVSDSSSGSSFLVTFTGSTSSGGSGGGGSGSGHHHGGGNGSGWWWFSNEQAGMSMGLLAAFAAEQSNNTQVIAPTGRTTATSAVAVQPSAQGAAALVPSMGLAGLTGSGGNRDSLGADSTEAATMPEVPPDGNQPGKPADRATPNANPEAVPMPPAALNESTAPSRACDACFTEGSWTPTATLEQEDDDGSRLSSIAAVVSVIALGGSWGVAREQAAERRRRLKLPRISF